MCYNHDVWRTTAAAILAVALSARMQPAAAQELDTLLPSGIPGYGKAFGVSLGTRAPPFDDTGVHMGSFSINPVLSVSAGDDSAPNGGAASAITAATTSLALADPILGFGAYAAGQWSAYPQNRAQNTSGLTLAAGEQAALATQTITLSTGYLRSQETGFSLSPVSLARPLAYTVQDLRGNDEITLGMFSLKPEASETLYRFPANALQNRNDTRGALTTGLRPGGPCQILLRLQFTQSNYRDPALNAATRQALLGIQDSAGGLWTFSALAGAATRIARTGRSLSAPVLEAGFDWMPTDFDKFRLTLAREIDDPDEISAAAYTLSEARLNLSHLTPGNVTFKVSAEISNAAFFNSTQRETSFGSELNISVPFGPYFDLNGDYTFNSRQANRFRAANEHIITLGVTWTP